MYFRRVQRSVDVPAFRSALFLTPLRVAWTIVDHDGGYFRRTIIKGVPRATLIAKEPISCSSCVKFNRRRMTLLNSSREQVRRIATVRIYLKSHDCKFTCGLTIAKEMLISSVRFSLVDSNSNYIWDPSSLSLSLSVYRWNAAWKSIEKSFSRIFFTSPSMRYALFINNAHVVDTYRAAIK